MVRVAGSKCICLVLDYRPASLLSVYHLLDGLFLLKIDRMPNIDRRDGHRLENCVDEIGLVRVRPDGATLVPRRDIQLFTVMSVQQLLNDHRLVIDSLHCAPIRFNMARLAVTQRVTTSRRRASEPSSPCVRCEHRALWWVELCVPRCQHTSDAATYDFPIFGPLEALPHKPLQTVIPKLSPVTRQTRC